MGFASVPLSTHESCSRTNYSLARTQANRLQLACGEIEEHMTAFRDQNELLGKQLESLNKRLTSEDRPKGRAGLSLHDAAANLRGRMRENRKVMEKDTEMANMACGMLLSNAMRRVEKMKAVCETPTASLEGVTPAEKRS